MDISLFDFELPEELIAQSPAGKRDESRLLVIDNEKKTYEDKIFHDIIDYLRPGDVLVRNNTKVLPARLFGVKEGTGAHVEVLLLKRIEGDTWECLTGNAKAIKTGSIISFNLNPEGRSRDRLFFYSFLQTGFTFLTHFSLVRTKEK